jgi:AmmeMemoRadiSam system protein A
MMHALIELARNSVEEFVKSKKVISPPEKLSPEMTGKSGVFVCIKNSGRLRGCIGTFMPCCGNIAEETIRNAISAASGDPRFPAVSETELSDLEFTVDVLSPPEKVEEISTLDHKKYGVIVSNGPRRGLLLPNLEGVDSVEEQLRITRMKAGISEDEPAEIFRFEVQRYR